MTIYIYILHKSPVHITNLSENNSKSVQYGWPKSIKIRHQGAVSEITLIIRWAVGFRRTITLRNCNPFRCLVYEPKRSLSSPEKGGRKPALSPNLFVSAEKCCSSQAMSEVFLAFFHFPPFSPCLQRFSFVFFLPFSCHSSIYLPFLRYCPPFSPCC